MIVRFLGNGVRVVSDLNLPGFTLSLNGWGYEHEPPDLAGIHVYLQTLLTALMYLPRDCRGYLCLEVIQPSNSQTTAAERINLDPELVIQRSMANSAKACRDDGFPSDLSLREPAGATDYNSSNLAASSLTQLLQCFYAIPLAPDERRGRAYVDSVDMMSDLAGTYAGDEQQMRKCSADLYGGAICARGANPVVRLRGAKTPIPERQWDYAAEPESPRAREWQRAWASPSHDPRLDRVAPARIPPDGIRGHSIESYLELATRLAEPLGRQLQLRNLEARETINLMDAYVFGTDTLRRRYTPELLIKRAGGLRKVIDYLFAHFAHTSPRDITIFGNFSLDYTRQMRLLEATFGQMRATVPPRVPRRLAAWRPARFVDADSLAPTARGALYVWLDVSRLGGSLRDVLSFLILNDSLRLWRWIDHRYLVFRDMQAVAVTSARECPDVIEVLRRVSQENVPLAASSPTPHILTSRQILDTLKLSRFGASSLTWSTHDLALLLPRMASVDGVEVLRTRGIAGASAGGPPVNHLYPENYNAESAWRGAIRVAELLEAAFKRGEYLVERPVARLDAFFNAVRQQLHSRCSLANALVVNVAEIVTDRVTAIYTGLMIYVQFATHTGVTQSLQAIAREIRSTRLALDIDITTSTCNDNEFYVWIWTTESSALYKHLSKYIREAMPSVRLCGIACHRGQDLLDHFERIFAKLPVKDTRKCH